MVEKREYLDFRQIKADADIEAVLAHLGLDDRLARQGHERVGWCPIGTKQHGKKDSFSFNVQKKTFQCFACKNRGSVLDLVAMLAGVQLREAARLVASLTAEARAPAPDRAPRQAAQARDALDEQQGEEAPAEDRAQLSPLMSLAEAMRRVKTGELDARKAVVLDVTAIDRVL